MRWRPLAALAAASIAFVAVGGLAGLLEVGPAALAVAALVCVAVAGALATGSGPPRLLSTPYW